MKLTVNPDWRLPVVFPNLIARQIHVWCAILDYTDEQLSVFYNLLTAEEQERAQRFHFTKDRARFVAARGILRKLLGQYLKAPPQELRLQVNSHGKPELIDYPALQFNLSHSHEIALYAIALEQAVGVDVEYIDNQRDIDAIAKRFFTPAEYQLLINLTGEAKQQAFFALWTSKEAFIKALGVGLSYSLDKVEITWGLHQSVKLLTLYDATQNVEDWYLASLDPVPNYAAAIVMKNPVLELKTFRWNNLFLY